MNHQESNNNARMGRRSALVAMFISAISMGFVGIMVDFLSRFSKSTIVLYRGIFGTFFLSIWLIKTKGFSKKFLKTSFKLHWKNLLILIFIYPTATFAYFLNIQISGYTVAAFLLYLNGMFLLGILYVSKEEKKIPKENIFSFILAIIGVLIIMEVWNGLLLIESIFFGLSSAILLAVNIYS